MQLNKQRWIAFDQWLHTLLNKYAMADETYSAACWRKYIVDPTNHKTWRTVDRLDRLWFFLFKEENHCRDSYLSELNRTQLPSHYSKGLYE